MEEQTQQNSKSDISHREITEKWQHRWAKAELFKTDDNSPKEKFYVLEMYPYPSASGLHMGHALNYTIGDIYARMKIMQGYNVLHPMGFDSFGLPSENAAIKAKSHPKKFTDEAVENYIRQMKGLGLSYDWDRMVATHHVDYYKWDQWIFLKMYRKRTRIQKNISCELVPKMQHGSCK
jgi:leucyl-tRNA synthetase